MGPMKHQEVAKYIKKYSLKKGLLNIPDATLNAPLPTEDEKYCKGFVLCATVANFFN